MTIHRNRSLLKFTLICILYSGVLTSVFSQTTEQIDSLNLHATSYRNVQTDSLYNLATKTLELSRDIDYTKGQIEAYTNLCFACYFKSTYDEAVSSCKKAIKLNNTSDDQSDDITTAYQFLGLTRINQRKNQEAVKVFSELINIATQQKKDYVLADACSNLGLAYLNLESYDQAKEYYVKAINIHENIDYPEGKVYVYHNIGRIYFDQGDRAAAETFLHQAADLAKQIDNHRALYYTYSLLGQIDYFENRQTQSYLLDAWKIADSLNMNYEKAEILYFLSELYLRLEDHIKTEQYSKMALIESKKMSNTDLIKKIYNILIKSYSLNKQFDKAQIFIEKSDSINDSKPSHSLLSSLLRAGKNSSSDLSREEDEETTFLSYEILVIAFIGSAGTAVILLGIVVLLLLKSNRKSKRLATDLKLAQSKLKKSEQHKEIYIKKLSDINNKLIQLQDEVFLSDIEISEFKKEQPADTLEKIITSTTNLSNSIMNDV